MRRHLSRSSGRPASAQRQTGRGDRRHCPWLLPQWQLRKCVRVGAGLCAKSLSKLRRHQARPMGWSLSRQWRRSSQRARRLGVSRQ